METTASGARLASGFRLMLTALVLAGLVVRGLILVQGERASGGRLDDPDQYLPLARSLVRTGSYALDDGRLTAYRPPLYPLVLAPLVAVLGDRIAWGVAGLHLVLGAGTILLTVLTARRWGLTWTRSLAAAAVVAFDPVLIAQARPVMTETLAAFLTSAILAALTVPGVRGAVSAGFVFGLAALCRPSAWPSLGLTAIAALGLGPGSLKPRSVFALVLVATAISTAAPWALRNARVFGEPVWTTTHGGYTLYLANNPVYYEEVVNGPPGAVWTGHNQWLWWDSVNHAGRGMSEPRADRLMRHEAIRVVVGRPSDFARASAARLSRFWGLAPAGSVYPGPLRLATAFWTAPLWVALVAGLARRSVWCWPRVSAPIALLCLTSVHLVYWTDMRMRATVVPALALVAAAADFPGRKRPSRVDESA